MENINLTPEQKLKAEAKKYNFLLRKEMKNCETKFANPIIKGKNKNAWLKKEITKYI